jgi:hypothetical protein
MMDVYADFRRETARFASDHAVVQERDSAYCACSLGCRYSRGRSVCQKMLVVLTREIWPHNRNTSVVGNQRPLYFSTLSCVSMRHHVDILT